MKSRKTVLVHLDSARGYSRDILRGIYAYNNESSNWNIVYEPAYFLRDNSKEDKLSIINHVQPDGCIIEFAENIQESIALGIPVVQVASVLPYPGIPVVLGNYDQEAQMAALYFKRKGFKNMAFFGISELSWSETRHASFRQYVEDDGCSFFSYLLEAGNNDILNSNFEALIQWLTNLPKPIGVLCCNDDFGQILINTCIMAGVKVPHEVSVLGIDNDDLICNITNPNLSSIARNHNKIAFDICHQLDEMMNGDKRYPEIIPAEPIEVCERASTDSLGYSDTVVSIATTFIRNNLSRSITVTEVAAQAKVSAKALNNRFKSVTGSSVHQEIQFQKLNGFKKLMGSNLSIKEIAYKLGFEDSSHVSRWFSNLEGISPVEWKKRYL